MSAEPRGHAGPLLASDERIVISVSDWEAIMHRLNAIEFALMHLGIEIKDPPEGA